MRKSIYSTLLCLAITVSFGFVGLLPGAVIETDSYSSGVSDVSEVPLIAHSFQLRQLALHDAGRIYLPISCGGFPGFGNYLGTYRDPETGLRLYGGLFPQDNGHHCIFSTSLWVGGVVDEDTLVSVAFDTWVMSMGKEFWPPDPEAGGVIRTGRFADDEFTAIFTDTVTDLVYVGGIDFYDDTVHTPLGIKVTQNSYSWRDTLYDDFVIIDFIIENIGSNYIREGWIGYNSDPDIHDTSLHYPEFDRASDDASGFLDTLLYDDDPDSRIMVPYCFDQDGDPQGDTVWDADISTRGAIAISLMDTGTKFPRHNFSWWIYGYPSEEEFGPRLVGTAEDPFRPFAGGHLGHPTAQKDKYYMMSHSEVDYNELEMDIHDSTDGWIPSNEPFLEKDHDTRLMYSFGPFDLLPGDSVTFALVVVGIDNFHVNPGDFAEYFDPEAPHLFQNRLDFTELMIDLRRADSVYESGFTLPNPGPPQGLHIVDYDDAYVSLVWTSSEHPALIGYFLNIKDTMYENTWRHAFQDPISDTEYTFSTMVPSHEHSFAVSMVDADGRESDVSMAVSIIPGLPHPPCSLSISLDDMTPVITWRPPCDTSLMVYMIYRSTWSEAFEKYDSVSALEYYDHGAESGVRYNYMVSAKNSMQLESHQIGPVSVMPMALDEGVLFYDLNHDASANFDPYHRRYVDRLVHAVQPGISMAYHDIEIGELSFKEMSRYSVIIFDSEKRGGKFPGRSLDSIGLYMSSGGRALFIIPNASTSDLTVGSPRLRQYVDGHFFHDILRIDSAITNSITLMESALWGDLDGCLPMTPEYPPLVADSSKLAAAPFAINGSIPLAGYIFPDDSVEIIYRYQSMYPDSTFHNQVNGIAFANDTYRFILFNFQLSLMGQPSNIMALRRGLEYLGVNVDCGDVNSDYCLDIGDAVLLIDYLYRSGPSPQDLHRADVDCDGEVSVGDALAIINVIFRDAAGLDCCPQEPEL